MASILSDFSKVGNKQTNKAIQHKLVLFFKNLFCYNSIQYKLAVTH